jgi:hypothetical protein
MQPGDNFVVEASTDPNFQNGVVQSAMLTVWRRLHVEVDTMGVAQQNHVLGATTFGVRIRPNQATTIPVNVTLEENRFEGGRLLINNDSFPVTSNTASTVTVDNTTGTTFSYRDAMQFQLFDDDDYNDDDGPPPIGDGTLDGDTGEDISMPEDYQSMPVSSTSLLTANSDNTNTNVFAAAYVHPVYDIADTRDNSIFQANVASDNATDIRPLFADRDSSSTNTANDFWTVYILGSYQHTLDEDNDPSTEGETSGIVDEITNVTGDLEGSGALIFLELHRTREVPNYNPIPTDVTSLANTVAHEVGHLFSGRHGELGLMGDINGQVLSSQFSPTTISRIRGLAHP